MHFVNNDNDLVSLQAMCLQKNSIYPPFRWKSTGEKYIIWKKNEGQYELHLMYKWWMDGWMKKTDAPYFVLKVVFPISNMKYCPIFWWKMKILWQNLNLHIKCLNIVFLDKLTYK